MGIHVQHDVSRCVDMGRLGFVRYAVEIEFRDTVPITPGTEQHVVIQIADITTLPEALYVLVAAPGADVLRPEIHSHQVQDPSDGRRTGPVHPQYEYLHCLDFLEPG